jgi:hypothetical protein
MMIPSRCLAEFRLLTAPVSDDPMAQHSVADLVSAAQFELDLHHEGDQEPPLTLSQVNALKAFVRRWA